MKRIVRTNYLKSKQTNKKSISTTGNFFLKKLMLTPELKTNNDDEEYFFKTGDF